MKTLHQEDGIGKHSIPGFLTGLPGTEIHKLILQKTIPHGIWALSHLSNLINILRTCLIEQRCVSCWCDTHVCVFMHIGEPMTCYICGSQRITLMIGSHFQLSLWWFVVPCCISQAVYSTSSRNNAAWALQLSVGALVLQKWANGSELPTLCITEFGFQFLKNKKSSLPNKEPLVSHPSDNKDKGENMYKG